jgi:hypothetical protein
MPARMVSPPGTLVTEETSEFLLSEGGFRSEHFTMNRLRGLVGDRTIRSLGSIAYAVTF